MSNTTANPLFISFLEELQKEAKRNHIGSRLAKTYGKAIISLKKYPLPLASVEEARLLEGIGDFVACKLQQKLDDYLDRITNQNQPLQETTNNNFMSKESKKSKTKENSFMNGGINDSVNSESGLFDPNTEVDLLAQSDKFSSLSELAKSLLPPGCSASQKTKNKLTFISDLYIKKVILLIDSREVKNRSEEGRSYFKDKLEKKGIEVEKRQLDLGDALWIAKLSNGEEVVLPYILERKILSDLCVSIQDGRYKEQKFRLKKSGLNVTYLVEGNMDKYCFNTHHMSKQTLESAMASTQLNGFNVVQTKTTLETIEYLSQTTKVLLKKYVQTPVQRGQFMSYDSFSEENSKTGKETITEIFAKQLMMIHGVSADKASKIIAKYQTPAVLIRAFDEYSFSQKETMIQNIRYGLSQRRFDINTCKRISELYISSCSYNTEMDL